MKNPEAVTQRILPNLPRTKQLSFFEGAYIFSVNHPDKAGGAVMVVTISYRWGN